MSKACTQGIRIVITATLILTIGINMMPVELAVPLVVENGPVELLTVIGYFAAAAWLVALPFFSLAEKQHQLE